MEIKVGCCGFPVSKEKYYKNFDVVEIQQTFYQPPEEKTVCKWRETAPLDFEFTLKAWQLITHPPSSPTYRGLKQDIPESKKKNYGFFKPTEEVWLAWEKTERMAQAKGFDSVYFMFNNAYMFEDALRFKEKIME